MSGAKTSRKTPATRRRQRVSSATRRVQRVVGSARRRVCAVTRNSAVSPGGTGESVAEARSSREGNGRRAVSAITPPRRLGDGESPTGVTWNSTRRPRTRRARATWTPRGKRVRGERAGFEQPRDSPACGSSTNEAAPSWSKSEAAMWGLFLAEVERAVVRRCCRVVTMQTMSTRKAVLQLDCLEACDKAPDWAGASGSGAMPRRADAAPDLPDSAARRARSDRVAAARCRTQHTAEETTAAVCEQRGADVTTARPGAHASTPAAAEGEGRCGPCACGEGAVRREFDDCGATTRRTVHEAIFRTVRSTIAASCALGHRSCQMLWGPRGCGKHRLARLVAQECRREADTLVLECAGNVLTSEEEALRAMAEQMGQFLRAPQSARLRASHSRLRRGGAFEFARRFDVMRAVPSEEGEAEAEEDSEQPDDAETDRPGCGLRQVQPTAAVTTVHDTNAATRRPHAGRPAKAVSGSVADAGAPAAESCYAHAIHCTSTAHATATENVTSGRATTSAATASLSATAEDGAEGGVCGAASAHSCTTAAAGSLLPAFAEALLLLTHSGAHVVVCIYHADVFGLWCDQLLYVLAGLMHDSLDRPGRGSLSLVLTAPAPDMRQLEKRLSSRLTCETRFVPLLPWTVWGIVHRAVESVWAEARDAATGCPGGGGGEEEEEEIADTPAGGLMRVQHDVEWAATTPQPRHHPALAREAAAVMCRDVLAQMASGSWTEHDDGDRCAGCGGAKGVVRLTKPHGGHSATAAGGDGATGTIRCHGHVTDSHEWATCAADAPGRVAAAAPTRAVPLDECKPGIRDASLDPAASVSACGLVARCADLSQRMMESGATTQTLLTAVASLLMQCGSGAVDFVGSAAARARVWRWLQHRVATARRREGGGRAPDAAGTTEETHQSDGGTRDAAPATNEEWWLGRRRWGAGSGWVGGGGQKKVSLPGGGSEHSCPTRAAPSNVRERWLAVAVAVAMAPCGAVVHAAAHTRPPSATPWATVWASCETSPMAPTPYGFDLLEAGRLCTAGYAGREAFWILVHVLMHHDHAVERSIGDVQEEMYAALGTRAAAKVDRGAFATAVQRLCRWRLLSVTEPRATLTLCGSAARVREFIYAVVDHQRQWGEEMLGLEPRDILRIHSMV